MGGNDRASEEFYRNLWGENFNKFKYISKYDWGDQTSIYYVDFGAYNFKRYYWEGCMYRIFEALNPHYFNRIYVEPMLKSYLNELGDGDYDSKVLKHILLCRIEIEYTEKGVLHSIGSEISDKLSMIEHLSIAEDWSVFSNSIKKCRLKELQKGKTAYKKDDGIWMISLYNIKDIELLKELGIYNEVLRFINEIERTYSRFLDGDYSQI